MALREEKKHKNEENGHNYIGDIDQIRRLCESYDLDDAASNQRLHRYLRDKRIFSTWIGKNFMLGLGNRAHSAGFRRVVQKALKILGVSLLVLALILVTAIAYQRVQEVREEAVLEYIRKERQVAEKGRQQRQETAPKTSGTEAAVPETENTTQILAEYAAFSELYPDAVGWLKVDGTPIDYPVMKDSTGEEFYLHHNFQGGSDNQGALFVDKDSSIMPRDDNLVIYGHNMRNNSIFGSLDNYLEQSYYEEHPIISFDTLYEKADYRIAAVIKTAVKEADEKGFRYYWFHNYGTEEEFKEFTDFVKQNQVFDTGETLEYKDQLVMLSTCEYSVDNGRLVVIARKQKEEKK